MEILASCTLEESKQYNGKLVIQDDDSKPIKVKLNILSKDGIDKSELYENVKSVTYLGTFPKFERKEGVSYFTELSLEDVRSGFSETEGITPILRLPDGFSQLKELVGYCSIYPTLRVLGGNLLAVEGLRVGRYEEENKKVYPIYNGIYDNFVEMNLADIDNVTEIVKKAKSKMLSDEKKEKKKKSSSSKSGEKKGSSKPKKSSVVSKSFSVLFGDSSEEEF